MSNNLISSQITSSPNVSICLNMIVRNESRIITRLLASVLPIIDTYVICDTGSTDNTPQIITDFMSQHGISGEVVHEPFRNFGYNRTFALQAARGKATYALLLDADMIFKIEPTFNKQSLTAGQYLVLQKGGSLSYHNTRLVRLDIDVKCLCPTHEYYDFPPGTSSERLDSLWIDDIGDGGCKSDKFDRDIRLLKGGIEEEPNNARYYFYLANSYFNSGRHAESIPYYKKRIELGGWHEEVFYAHLNLGHAYMTTKQDALALETWMDAYNLHSQRSETIYEIAKYYRLKGKNKIGMAFCMLGRAIPYPKNDNLFIHNDVYNTGFDYELSILGFYNNYPNLHKVSCSLLNKPFHNRGSVISNYKFYYPKLSKYLINKLGGSQVKVKQAICGVEYDLFGSTPSIFQVPNTVGGKSKYYINLRMVNYTINRANGGYNMTGDGKITTANQLFPISQEQLEGKTPFSFASDGIDGGCGDSNRGIMILPTDNTRRYVGIEDLKPYFGTSSGTSSGSAASGVFMGTIQSPRTGNISVGYGKMDLGKIIGCNTSPSLDYSVVETVWDKTCEKNWVFYGDNKLIYSWYPLITGKIVEKEDKSLQFEETGNYAMPEYFRDVRGSTHGYEFDGEVWFLCHLVEYCQPREYYHFFVVMDKDTMKPKRWTYLFKFEGEKIEYALGMIVNENNIVVSYSKWDSEPTIGIYDKFKVEMEMMV